MKLTGIERESSGRNVVLLIISDMDLTSTSLGSKELNCILYK